MCGIVYVRSLGSRKNQKSAVDKVLELFENQKSRGTQGLGFVAIKNHTVIGYKRFEEVDEMKTGIALFDKADEILFHHRYPTSTPNIAESNHPIKVSHSSLEFDYYVVHNGHINNSSTLETKHRGLGFKYRTAVEKIEYVKSKYPTKERADVLYEYKNIEKFNDSESLAIELALTIESKQSKVDTSGGAAFIALQVDKKTKKVVKMFHGRNTNPLVIGVDKDYYTLSSQHPNRHNDDVPAYKMFSDSYEGNLAVLPLFSETVYTAPAYGYGSAKRRSKQGKWKTGYGFTYEDEDYDDDDEYEAPVGQPLCLVEDTKLNTNSYLKTCNKHGEENCALCTDNTGLWCRAHCRDTCSTCFADDADNIYSHNYIKDITPTVKTQAQIAEDYIRNKVKTKHDDSICSTHKNIGCELCQVLESSYHIKKVMNKLQRLGSIKQIIPNADLFSDIDSMVGNSKSTISKELTDNEKDKLIEEYLKGENKIKVLSGVVSAYDKTIEELKMTDYSCGTAYMSAKARLTKLRDRTEERLNKIIARNAEIEELSDSDKF